MEFRQRVVRRKEEGASLFVVDEEVEVTPASHFHAMKRMNRETRESDNQLVLRTNNSPQTLDDRKRNSLRLFLPSFNPIRSSYKIISRLFTTNSCKSFLVVTNPRRIVNLIHRFTGWENVCVYEVCRMQLGEERTSASR